MKEDLKTILQKDIYRFYGSKKIPMKKKVLPDIELKYILTYRKARYYKQKNKKIKSMYNKLKLKHMQYKYTIQIPSDVEIGNGLYIGHLGRIIINPNVKIGKNVNIATGVTIGKENRGKRKGTPTIGDNVWIGTNAVIVGKIEIGSNVLIAPNTYINFNVPDNSIVIGNPGKIIQDENACENYIENTI